MDRKLTFHSLVLGLLILGASAGAAAPRCDWGALDPQSVKKVEGYYAATVDPEKALGVKLKTLSQELGHHLTAHDVHDLTRYFHDLLVTATTDASGKPVPFAEDNLNHVALHYRDLEDQRQSIDEYFGHPGDRGSVTDLALLVAASHDQGKVSTLNGLVSPGVNAIYDAAVADAPQLTLFIKNILGHDGLSMNAIEEALQRFAAGRPGWSPEKIARVASLLKAGIARHNAGYGRLPEDAARGIRHFWQSNYGQFAERMRALGLDISDEYPAASGGWMPALLALVDRGTSLHESFVEKIAGQGALPWTGAAVGGLLVGNANSVAEEIDVIARELGRHVATGKRIEDFPLYQKYQVKIKDARHLGEAIIAMNDFTSSYEGRPEIKLSERPDTVYYVKHGVWYRVHKAEGNQGKLQRYTGDPDVPWVTESTPSGMTPAQILMRQVIGYAPILNHAPN